jgi:general secretion pathway protein A
LTGPEENQQEAVRVNTMYINYFGLTEAPFSIAPDPRFLYLSDQHREALAHLLFGVSSNGGFVLLTGEVGTGKTTVSRCLLEQLPEDTEVALILNPKYSVKELLTAICDDLGIAYKPSSEMKDYVDALNEHLLENHRNNRNTVLLIDEAQNLSADVLETIRLLTNLETNTQKLLQIIFVGQPELLTMLERSELRQLNQRITARYHLRALHQDELADYIAHRLSIAGVELQLFPRSTLRRLHRLTKGIPRLVNIVCDRALLGAFVERDNEVRPQTLEKAASEVFGNGAQPASFNDSSLRRIAVISIPVALLIAAALIPQVRALMNPTQPADAESPPPIEIAAASPTPELPASTEAEMQQGTAAKQLPDPPELSNPANWQWPDSELAAVTQVVAYQDLLGLWGISYQPRENPDVCRFADSQGLRCLFGVSDLGELAHLNRAALLSMFNPQGQKYYSTLIAIQDDLAQVKLAGRMHWVRLDDLKLWLDGDIMVFWRKPKAYNTVVMPGDSGPMIAWLDEQLAAIQGRAPLGDPPAIYGDSLLKQVRGFQISKGLSPDGAVGPQTVIQMNTVTQADLPLLLRPATEG